MRLVLYFLLFNIYLKINIIPFKVVPLGSHTPPETLLPLPVAVLEIFMSKCPQLFCHDLLDVVHSSKMTTFEVEFEFWEKEEVTRTQIIHTYIYIYIYMGIRDSSINTGIRLWALWIEYLCNRGSIPGRGTDLSFL